MAKSSGVLSGLLFFFGALLALAGIVFTLQGLGIVGPASSFMYQSSTWFFNGIALLVVGLVVISGGALVRSRSKRASVGLNEPSTQPSSSSAPTETK